MKLAHVMFQLVLLIALAACSATTSGSPHPTSTELPAMPLPQPSKTSLPQAPSSPAARGQEEAILILEPGPGSRLTSPVHIAGVADPTFEQTLLVRIVLDEGTEIATDAVIISADSGQRGPFEDNISFNVSGERNALIQIYDQSARDGGIIHLASVGVVLTDAGPVQVILGDIHAEAIVIEQPAHGATISGGVAHVEGFGLASFEQTLVIEVHDAEGNVVGAMPIIVNAPDWGVPGPFSADIPYDAAAEGPGRIVVIDPLPAFNGLGHISSVAITLAP